MNEPEEVAPDVRAEAWTAAFMASIGQTLTPRLRRHLIAALQREQDEWERRTGGGWYEPPRPGFWARVWKR